jgi:hypothetical protein
MNLALFVVRQVIVNVSWFESVNKAPDKPSALVSLAGLFFAPMVSAPQIQ